MLVADKECRPGADRLRRRAGAGGRSNGAVTAIGSGGNYALAAARALLDASARRRDDRPPRDDRSPPTFASIPITISWWRRFDPTVAFMQGTETHGRFLAARDRFRTRSLHRRTIDAKRAVAIALRNRWRRLRLEGQMREEVLPKNILMIGPTGCGKTEIARRLARLANAPFLKVEATKFTEVGYVGRDVEQIVRDLVEVAIMLVKERRRKDVEARAQLAAEERVLDALVGPAASAGDAGKRFAGSLRAGELDDKEIEIEIASVGPLDPDVRTAQYARQRLRLFARRYFRQGHAGPRARRASFMVKDAHRAARRRGERQADRSGRERARGDPRCREQWHRLHRRDGQDLRARGARRRATCRAKACSATCCR